MLPPAKRLPRSAPAPAPAPQPELEPAARGHTTCALITGVGRQVMVGGATDGLGAEDVVDTVVVARASGPPTLVHSACGEASGDASGDAGRVSGGGDGRYAAAMPTSAARGVLPMVLLPPSTLPKVVLGAPALVDGPMVAPMNPGSQSGLTRLGSGADPTVLRGRAMRLAPPSPAGEGAGNEKRTECLKETDRAVGGGRLPANLA